MQGGWLVTPNRIVWSSQCRAHILGSTLRYTRSDHIILPFWGVSPKTMLVLEINNYFSPYILSTAFCSQIMAFTAPQFFCHCYGKMVIALSPVSLCSQLVCVCPQPQKRVCECVYVCMRVSVHACVFTRERVAEGGCIMLLLPISLS